MKRILVLVLALAMLAALVGCGAEPAPAPAPTAEPAPAPAPAADPFKAAMPKEIYAEAAEVNPEGKTIDVLIVVDMQKDFVDGSLGTAEAVAIVPNVVAKIEQYKKDGGLILATKDTHEEGYLETQEGVNLPVEHCFINTPGWELDAAVLAAMPEDAEIFNKPTFGSKDLVGYIGGLVAEYGEPYVNVELIGVCTDICVLSNSLLLKAFYPEMPISLDASCCAGVTPFKHDAAIESMRSCQIQVTNYEYPTIVEAVAPVDPLISRQPSAIYADAEAANPDGESIEVLLVIDMQKDFVDQALGTAEAVEIVPAVVAKINEYKERGAVIIATRDTHEESYMDTQEGANLPVVHCVKDTDGWLLNTDVAAALEGYDKFSYIDKPTFGSTDLVKVMGEYVKQYGEPNVKVEIIGLCTDICVVSNALIEKAFYPEMPIILDAKCCAGVSVETHNAALATMKCCQIGVYNEE